MRLCCGVVVFLALLMGVRAPVFAQADSATLSGTVTDPSGAIITNATVEATNPDTNLTQATRTNSAGLYSFPRLPPGRYRVSVKSTGFKEFVETELVLHVGDTVSLNFKMELGSATESVSVTANSPLVNTHDATFWTLME